MKIDVHMVTTASARNCYYAVTHPMQFGTNATYNDWINCIMQTFNVGRGLAEKIARLDTTNILHRN